jgi:hypothetical protein
MEVASIKKILNDNKDIQFVDRIINKDNYPVLNQGDGSYATHKMAWSGVDNGFIVYPTIFWDGSRLIEYSPGDAVKHALNTGDYIKFNNAQTADQFSKEYKKVWSKNKPETQPAIDPFKNNPPYGYPAPAVDPFGGRPPVRSSGQAVDPLGESTPHGAGETIIASTPSRLPAASDALPISQPGAALSPEPEQGFFGRMMDRMRGISLPNRDKAANIMALSSSAGVSPATAMDHYSELTSGLRDQPDVKSALADALKASGRTVQNIALVYPALESAAQIISSTYGIPVSGLAGLVGSIGGEKAAKDLMETAQKLLVYEPKTVRGKELTETAAYPFRKLHDAGQAAGDITFDKTGSPGLATAAATAVEGLPAILAGRGVARSSVKAITESNMYRMATIPERGLVVQSLEETLAKNPGMSEADLVKLSDRYFSEAMARRKNTEPSTVPVDDVGTAPVTLTKNNAGVDPQGIVPKEISQDIAPLDINTSANAARISTEPITRPLESIKESPSGPETAPPTRSEAVDPFEDSPPLQPAEEQRTRISTKGQNVRTLRGAIKAKGGINFMNFTGELRDMPLSVKYMARRSGRPIDTLESELKGEGWLSPDESLMDILRDNPAVLRRGPLSQDFGDKPVHEFTPQEKQVAKDMAYEPEAPPEGEYKSVDAQDLPVGENLTIIDGSGPRGWDTYKVIGKDPFGVTLKDGKIIELKPFDAVNVKVDGIEEKIGSDGLFGGKDVHVDHETGDVSSFDAGSVGGKEDPGLVHPAGGSSEYKAPTGFASTDDYGHVPVVMQMPEIVELAQKINQGKYPRIKRMLRGSAIGRFRHAGSRGGIDLQADIFKDTDTAAKVMAHEIGHMVDWLPDKDLSRGNLLGRIASLKKYMKHQIEDAPGAGGLHITAKEKAELRKEAARMLEAGAEEVVDKEITSDLPVTPEDVLSIFNAMEPLPGVTQDLHNYIKGLSTAEKKSIVKAAMKGLVPDDLQRFARKMTERVREKKHIRPEDIDRKFKELFLAELKKRRLIHLDQVKAELKAVTQKWRPFDETVNPAYTKYRHSSKELYADAISALITNPGFLKQEAPTFYRSFFNHLESKPDIKRVYDEIQELLTHGSEALSRHRVSNIHAMFKRGHAARKDLAERSKPRTRGILDTLITGLVDRNYAALKQIRALEKKNSPAGKRARLLRYSLEELPYLAAEADVYLRNFKKNVTGSLTDAGVSPDDLGVYMFQKRVLGDRSGIANPLGHSPKNVEQDLENQMNAWGPEKTKAVESAAEAFRAIREELIFPLMRESGLFSDEMMKKIEDTEDYAKFSVLHYLEEKLGSGVSAKIYHQIGTLSEIENPVVPTVLQDLSVIRASRINMVKRDLVTTLKDLNLVTPAELRYSLDAKGRVPVEPKDPWVSVMTVMDHGKPSHFIVSKTIADMFVHAPVEASALTSLFRAVSQPIREILVSKNPVWMARNVVRDFLATVKNNPSIRMRDTIAIAKYYKAAWPEVWNEIFKGERSPDIEEMMSLKALGKHRQWSKWDDSMETELDRLAADFELIPTADRAYPGALGAIKKVWAFLDDMGRVSETLGKVAGFKYLSTRSGKDIRAVAHDVRTRIGTPDIKRTGAWNILTNNMFMFSNVNKEGLRSAVEAAKEDPGRYAWKTLWINVLPKVIIGILGSGAAIRYVQSHMGLSDDDPVTVRVKKLQRVVNGISEYDKSMYTIVPIGLTKDGKSVYLRFPQDYEGQFFGALAWKLFISGKLTGPDGAVNLVAEQSPYKPNPLITAAMDLFTYYVWGQNPTDDFRGRPVMSDRVFKAGGMDAHKAMGKHTWSTLGGNVIYSPSFDSLDVGTPAVEKLLRVPPFNVIGTFVKISDQGIKERVQAEITAIEKEKAKTGLVRTQGLIRIMNGETVTPEQMIAIMQQPAGARKRELQGFLARKCGNAYMGEYLRAKTNEEKNAVIRVMLDDNFTANKGE